MAGRWRGRGENEQFSTLFLCIYSTLFGGCAAPTPSTTYFPVDCCRTILLVKVSAWNWALNPVVVQSMPGSIYASQCQWQSSQSWPQEARDVDLSDLSTITKSNNNENEIKTLVQLECLQSLNKSITILLVWSVIPYVLPPPCLHYVLADELTCLICHIKHLF